MRVWAHETQSRVFEVHACTHNAHHISKHAQPCPAGYADKALVIECSPQGLLVQCEDSAPLIDRLFHHAVDAGRTLETYRTQDNRVCAIALPKGQPGEAWVRLFAGDSDGARCMEPPYSMSGKVTQRAPANYEPLPAINVHVGS